MKNQPAYLVFGPESSGTRLATSILINAGCYGSAEHVQPLDTMSPESIQSIPSPIVWRRSFPHGGHVPIISDLINRVHPRPIKVIVTVRDLHCIRQSQTRDNQHATSIEQASDNIRLAYKTIFNGILTHSLDFHLFVYESIIASPAAQFKFIEDLGLPGSVKPLITYNGNSRYY